MITNQNTEYAHVTGEKRGKTRYRWKARENMLPVKS